MDYAKMTKPELIREVEKLDRMKAFFIEAVAHELRTPLTPLKSVVEMFLDGSLGEVTSHQRECLEMMDRNIERLKHFIEEVTSLSRLESSETILRAERMSVTLTILDVVSVLRKKAQKRDISLTVGHQTELFTYADPGAVFTVLTNLIDNAVIHNPEGTRVTISTQLTGDDFVKISVSDNGNGIPEGMLKNVFDKFSLSRREHGPGYRGVGIGLAVCRKLVKKMGGEIWAKSSSADGTTFSFTLPIRRKSVATDPR